MLERVINLIEKRINQHRWPTKQEIPLHLLAALIVEVLKILVYLLFL